MDRLIGFYKDHYSVEFPRSLGAAVSGGSDSVSLLVMAARWAAENNIQIHCLTVDHKLRKESGKEAEFVENLCGSLGASHKILDWDRGDVSIERGKLENLAREARYRLMSEYCENNAVPILMIGHTWNDQLETFEMRKNAGSSPSGLAGMSQVRSLTNRVKLLRPMLHFSKSHLEEFLRNRNISWKIDPMNDQEIFLRVIHRKKIMRYEADKISLISNEIIQLGRRRNQIETLAVCFLRKFCEFFKDGYAIVEKNQLLAEDESTRAEILKRLIWNVGGKKYATTITKDLCEQILCKKINTIGRCFLKIKKDKIFVFRENRNNESSIRQGRRFAEKETSWGLPYGGQNHKMSRETDGSRGDLSNKINLFDVFL
ncbi:MAG: tRNA lysidine(34) synthetase TilS [Holosporaceae bacterium]|jgi:tRNA(Ile)-lysidine synthase|nr:tRNA lysidine(34) synthetase TilS [Holosporaceae bacterium]